MHSSEGIIGEQDGQLGRAAILMRIWAVVISPLILRPVWSRTKVGASGTSPVSRSFFCSCRTRCTWCWPLPGESPAPESSTMVWPSGSWVPSHRRTGRVEEMTVALQDCHGDAEVQLVMLAFDFPLLVIGQLALVFRLLQHAESETARRTRSRIFGMVRSSAATKTRLFLSSRIFGPFPCTRRSRRCRAAAGEDRRARRWTRSS